ncbi:MAG: hypothetical protein K2I13_03765, partial [Alistipes sp.]|nr:hypothetical protein [Alistipes sp.]
DHHGNTTVHAACVPDLCRTQRIACHPAPVAAPGLFVAAFEGAIAGAVFGALAGGVEEGDLLPMFGAATPDRTIFRHFFGREVWRFHKFVVT